MAPSLRQWLPTSDELLELEFEELAPYVLQDLNRLGQRASQYLHAGNYASAIINSYRDDPRTAGSGEALIAQHVSVAWRILENMTLIAAKLDQQSGWYEITSRGKAISEIEEYHAVIRQLKFPSDHIHPILVAETRHSFVRGRFYSAVFDAARVVEDEVRKACGLDSSSRGQRLMADAFHIENGPLTDSSESKSEREGLRSLATGFMARFRNATGHSRPDLEPDEAIDAIHSASYLLRIVESRSSSKDES